MAKSRRQRKYRGGKAHTRAARRAQARAQQRNTNRPANAPLAPAAINNLNRREANLSPNIQGQLNRIKQKITNINQSLGSFKPTQPGGKRRG